MSLSAPLQFDRLDPDMTQDALGINSTPERGDTLLLAVEKIRLRGYRRVLWQRYLWQMTNRYPAQGLAIPHEEIDIACLGLDSRSKELHFYRTNAQSLELTEKIADLEKEQSEAKENRLNTLIALFSLSPTEVNFLTLCVAPEIDPRLRRLYGYIHDDITFCAATPWLAQTLFEWDGPERISPNSALIHWLLAYPGANEEQPWSLMARWLADPRIVGFLCGYDDLAPSLQLGARWLTPNQEAAYEPSVVSTLRDAWTSSRRQNRRVVQLAGAAGIGRKTWAAKVCADQGQRLLCLDVPQLFGAKNEESAKKTDANARDIIIRAEREALLQNCILYWNHADKVTADTWVQLAFTGNLQLFGVDQPIRFPANAPHADLFYFPLPTPQQSQLLWNHILEDNLKNIDISMLAERFTLTPAEIMAVATRAKEGPSALWAACRTFSLGRLGKLATVLPCPFTWEDIVLPPDINKHLQEIASQALHRSTVYDLWGFGQKRPLGRGVSAMFAGPSGTGKTMAAQVLAAHIGVVLFRIDLASVVSKYVGETEKNLREIFDEAERLNAVIFFDEADALFGKRTEVKDAHDRYANIEVNYLLQRMESYDGLAILATNRKGDIDPAFLRRLRFIVDFPMPGVSERILIWQKALPKETTDGTALLDEMDWTGLARRLEISGASIKDIALGAAFLACAESSKIGMSHLMAAARREMAKHGRLI
ncbi:MAG: ATP-binding protein [Proteobacteria bacterium]|nr:ATP-binding protein [Pseudomonadota bacterium]